MTNTKESKVACMFERLKKEGKIIKLTAEETCQINSEIHGELEKFNMQSKERQFKSLIDAEHTILT